MVEYHKNTHVSLPKHIKILQNMMEKVSLGKGDIALDCGANVGDITQWMAMTGADVYAFEPNPHAFAILKNRFEGMEHVTCFQKAVGECDDRKALYFHKDAAKDPIKWSVGSSLLSYKGNVDPFNFLFVDLMDLSQFIKQMNQRIKFAKMDVEGVECAILHRLIDTRVIQDIDLLLVELHDTRIPELRRHADRLRLRISQEKLTNIFFDWI